MKKSCKSQYYRQLLAATLLVGGAFQLAAPVLAQTSPSAAAGTSITNTGTATYEDPNNPGTTLNTTSNTVTVTVAEVAGITATGAATTDVDGGTVLPNNVINYDFLITNVGNNPTRFFIPGTTTVTGPGTAGVVQIVEVNGTTLGTPINVPAAGTTTDLLSGFPGAGSVAAGGTVRVRVPVTVNALAPSGAAISVLLGNTGANNNSAGTQNQAYPTAPSGNDLYTADNSGTANGDISGPPANGEREASAIQQVLVGAQPQAFAAVLKTRTGYTPNTAALTDDVLPYGLSLRVDSTAPSGSSGIVPEDLVGTPVTVDGSSRTLILVSDAIPAGTVLNAAPVAPAGWRAVYSTTATSTNANAATWTTTAPTFPAASVTRVGFIYDPDSNLTTASPAIAAGTTVTGFSFQVVTSGVTTTTTIANIAQVFGQTEGGGTTLVYDESGDQNPSNVNDNGSPGSNTPTTGVANPGTDGIDTNNNNTGTGPGGEDNTYTIAAPGAILNGPNGQPAAVGPTNNNDDFSNRSTPVPAGIPPNPVGGIDPASITFSNTINNPSTTTALTNVLLVPDTTGFTPVTGTQVLPPTNTTVTLTFGSQTAVYTFNGTNFIFTSGTAITIPSIAPGVSVNYTAAVNLPGGTPLSTDTGEGFSVPIFAFQDTNSNARPDAADTTQNRTIDRVYTGYLKLVKEARILAANGTTVLEGFTTGTPATTNIQPGNFIEYRITYSNISTPAAGSGNLTLNASNAVITESGVLNTAAYPAPPSGNNWGQDYEGNGVIDTSNVVGTAVDSGTGATITYFSGATGTTAATDQTGTTPSTDVTRYVNTISVPIEPTVSRTFTFRRRIN